MCNVKKLILEALESELELCYENLGEDTTHPDDILIIAQQMVALNNTRKAIETGTTLSTDEYAVLSEIIHNIMLTEE